MHEITRNFCLRLAYDGSRYRGWQKQGNTENTIQEKMETLLSRLLGQEIELAGSGRTDAGVHAREQFCSFRAKTPLSTDKLLREIRHHLPEDIAALSLDDAPPRFHARLSCREKCYVYRIWNSPVQDVFQRRYMLFHPGELDISAMKKAADVLIGRHDFSAFCTKHNPKKSAVRELRSINTERIGDEIRIMLTGDGFLYNMVRIIVGTLLEAGEGKRDAASVSEALKSLYRRLAGPTAPAHGLFMWSESY